MTDHNVVLTVAAYGSKAAAEQDFAAVGSARSGGKCRHIAAAVLGKGPDGALTIYLSDGVEPDVAWGGALLGAALTVVAAPAGILFLPPVVSAPAGWARVAALVAHYWQDLPQEELHQMSNLLESSPAGLVVVAVDQTREDIVELLSEMTAAISICSTPTDLGAEFVHAIDDANSAG